MCVFVVLMITTKLCLALGQENSLRTEARKQGDGRGEAREREELQNNRERSKPQPL